MMSDFEDDVPPVLESKPAPAAPPPNTSLLARLLNVLSVPGQVFEEVRAARHSVWNWLVPLPAYALSLAVFAAVFVSIPSMEKMWTEQISKKRTEQAAALTDAVKAGKIKQDAADDALAGMDWVSRPKVVKSLALAGGLFYGLFRVFWWAGVLWFLARVVIKTPIPYGKALEVVGLASVVAVIGNLALVALMLDFNKTFADGFALTVTDFASSNHQLLVATILQVFKFWLIAVLGTGLARLTGVTWMRATFLVITYWMGTELLQLVLGIGLG